MNRPSPLTPRNDSDLIRLVPERLRNALPARLSRWSAFLILGALGAVLVLAILRVGSIFLFRSSIAEAAGDVARIGGADPYLSGWMTGMFPFLASLVAFGIAVRLLLALVFPWLGGPKVIKMALLAGGATLLFSLAPGTLMRLLKVGPDGLSAEMVEVDPGVERWFDRDERAKIYWADHLDGTRRFWNAPGASPWDGSIAVPVTREVRLEWEREKFRRDLEEEARRLREESEQAKRDLEEARQIQAMAAAATSAAAGVAPSAVAPRGDSLRIADAPISPAGLTTYRPVADELPTSAPVRHLTAEEVAALLGGAVPASDEVQASAAPRHLTAEEAVALLGGAAHDKTPNPDHRLELVPGRTLALRLDRRAAEIRTDGTVELTRPGFTGAIVLGADFPRVFSESETIHVRVVGRRTVALQLRWLDALPDRRIPMVAYDGVPQAGTVRTPNPPAAVPASPRMVPASAARPAQPRAAQTGAVTGAVHRYPLPRPGATVTVQLRGGAVECWSDVPVHFAAGSGGAVHELLPGQRMRVTGAPFLVAGTYAQGTGSLYVKTVSGGAVNYGLPFTPVKPR